MLHVFRHRNFRLFFFGQFMSLLGTWLQNVAVGWLVYDMTRSPFLLGLTMFLQQAPIFFLAAFAGTYVDRIGRRRMMALTQILFCIQSVILATLTLSGNISIEIILVLAIFYGLVNAFDGPVRHGFAYELVARTDVKAAIAVNSMQFNIARMVGPSIAGFLILVIGEGGCFALNSVSFAFTLGVLYLLRLPPHEKREHKAHLKAIKEAFDYVGANTVIRTALLMTGLATVFGGAFLSLMPAFARDVVHADPTGLGFLMAAIGLGALFGTITLAHIPEHRLDNVPLYTAIGMGISLVVFAQTSELWMSLIAVLPASACLMLGGASVSREPPSEELIAVPGEPAPEPAPQKIEPPGLREILRLFRIRNYRLMFIGFLVSLLGSWVQVIAQGWLVYELTHSPFWLGVVTFSSSIPVFFVTPFGGTIADRMDRKKLFFITQILFCIQSGILAVLTLTDHVSVAVILILGVLQGIVNAFDIPARQSLLLELVGPENLKPAIAMNSITVHISRLLGPPLGGILVAAVGIGWCFAINTLSFSAIMIGLFLMRVAPRVINKASHPLRDLRDGFVYAWHTRNVREALLIVSVAGGLGGTYLAMMPAIASELLGLDARGMGVLMSAIGVGALLGAYGLARLGNHDLSRVNMLACAGLGLSLLLFAQSRSLPLSMLLLVPTSFGLMLSGGCTQTVMQSGIGEDMRGRMIALYVTFFSGSSTWGTLVMGWLGEEIGVGRALTLGGISCFAVALLLYVRRFGWRLAGA